MASHTKSIGDIGVAATQLELLKHDIKVLIPFDDNSKYDLVMVVDDQFYKLQVKTTEKVKFNEYMEFATCITDPYNKTNRAYEREEVDYFCLYCLENNWLGMLNFDEYNQRKETKIRVAPPKVVSTGTILMEEDFRMHDRLIEWFNKDYLKSAIVHDEYNKEKRKRIRKKKPKNPDSANREKIKLSKEELEEAIFTKPISKIAEECNCSEVTIRRWCKKYGLPDTKTEVWNILREKKMTIK